MPRHQIPTLFTYALAALPSPVGLRTGTAYEITDYGGNIATVVNGAWRFEYPFRTTWADRPAIGLVPVGTELQVTDYANQKWINNGTYWRPSQGRALIKQALGTLASPVAVVSGAAAGFFSIPGGSPKLPAGMIIPNSRVVGHAEVKKEGTGGNFVLGFRLGTSSDDGSMMAVSYGPSAAGDCFVTAAANFGASKTAFSTLNTNSPYQTSFSPGTAIFDKEYLVNTAVDMNVLIDISNGNAADTYKLINFSVWLEA